MRTFTAKPTHRVYFCRCGHVHIESRHRRISVDAQTFIQKLHQAANTTAEVTK